MSHAAIAEVTNGYDRPGGASRGQHRAGRRRGRGARRAMGTMSRRAASTRRVYMPHNVSEEFIISRDRAATQVLKFGMESTVTGNFCLASNASTHVDPEVPVE